jgi:hypothetical protein
MAFAEGGHTYTTPPTSAIPCQHLCIGLVRGSLRKTSPLWLCHLFPASLDSSGHLYLQLDSDFGLNLDFDLDFELDFDFDLSFCRSEYELGKGRAAQQADSL